MNTLPQVNDKEIQKVLQAIEEKDLSTAAHTWRVVLYTRTLAEAAGLDHAMVERVSRAAALHDIGKLAVPDAILQKPGKLTDDEFERIKQHAAAGHEMLLAMGETDEVVLDFVRHHHEKLDGSGYPDRLVGEGIPTGSRFFAVVDTFDALTSIRPYRMDVGPEAAERALTELRTHTNTWYWAPAVDLFEKLYRDGQLTWIASYFNDSCPLPVVPVTRGEGAHVPHLASPVKLTPPTKPH